MPTDQFDPLPFDDEPLPFKPRGKSALPPPTARSWGGLLLLIAGGLLVVGWPVWAGFYTDWLWFQQLGYSGVFTITLMTEAVLGASVGLLALAFFLFNFRLALRLSPESGGPRRFVVVNEETIEAPDFGALVGRVALPAALVLGAVLGLQAWGRWDTLLLYRHRTAFGEVDPIFGRDLSFYFFSLPVYEAVAELCFALVGIALVGSALIYAARAATSTSARDLWESLRRGPRTHLLLLLALLLVVVAGQTWLRIPNLLLSHNGPVAGASYTDLNATLPLLYVRVFVSLLCAALAAASVWRAGSGLLLAGAGLWLLAFVVGWLYPAAVQRFSVAPNELAKETPYINHNIAATRKAFALDRVEERETDGEKTLTAADVQKNQPTIKNIRLWDQRPLLDTFAQIQEIRTYYEFQSVDNDRYRLDGQLQQVMLSPRELASASLPNRNWINERLTFTHGFGLTLGPVDRVTPEGLPVLFVKDIPPVVTMPSLKVERPEIYFGEATDEHVYVKTNAKEFNYPAGEENVFRNYEGDGGVAIGSLWRRLLFATRFADLKQLLSNDLTPDSRVLFHRNIKERLAKVAPFLRFDADPYMVIADGRLYWIADAYTVSNRYPYSQPMGDINYIRNSVKAVIDAYHGDARLYIVDEGDPLIQTWASIFPGILKPQTEMPEALRTHLRYPEDIFKLQTAVYSTYHMDQTQAFYNKEDQWTAAAMTEAQGAEPRAMEPYYTIMKLPGEQTEEFILMLPFTPKSKDNLAAWMVARADGVHYGKLSVYRFPKQKLIYGPKQIVARVNQDPEISRQLTLWNQRGSSVILGTLMVIPIEESLIYVQPLYLRAESGRIPELRRVIVAADNRIAMEPTLQESLARLFGAAPAATPTLAQTAQPGTPAAPTTPPPTDARSLTTQAKEHYDRALQAQREGDWARYGEELKRLGAVLQQLSRN